MPAARSSPTADRCSTPRFATLASAPRVWTVDEVPGSRRYSIDSTTPGRPPIGSFGGISGWDVNPKQMLPVVVICALGCLVGFTGCSGVSPTRTQRARQPPAHRPEHRVNHAEPVDHGCARIRCRRFAVSGGTPIQDTTSDPSSDQAQSDPSGQSCVRAQYLRAAEEANDVVEGAAVLGAPDGAELMRHFLSGRGTPLTFGPTSRIAGLIARNASFQRLNRAVKAELKKQLAPFAAGDRHELPAHITLDRGSLLAVRPSFDNLARDPDLYLSFRGTQGLSVRGGGRAYFPAQPDQPGRTAGTLTYTIGDVYGFSSEPQFRLLGHPVGPDLHYLQTNCGAPAHKDGAHWFRDAVIVTTRFRFPLS
jgi:hypothetical protein